MGEHLLFVTGRLAEAALRRVLDGMGALPWTWEVRQIGVKVAALMTPPILLRRLGPLSGVSRIVLPGRFKGDLEALSRELGVPLERGPDELKDLPMHFGRAGPPPDLSRHDTRIFAEIVEAPMLDVAGIVARARMLVRQGADVIDLGCLPGTRFPHLEDAVAGVAGRGDAGQRRFGRSGRAAPRAPRPVLHFLLSLTEETLDLALETDAVPVLIPARHGDLESLVRACERLDRAGRPYLADPILDPIHFGFTQSLVPLPGPAPPPARGRDADGRRQPHRAHRCRHHRHHHAADGHLLGAGDPQRAGGPGQPALPPRREGGRAWRGGSCSPPARRARPPQGLDPGLLCLRDRRPFPDTPAEIAELAAAVTDPNFRIEVAEDGLHVYNRDGHHVASDPFDLFPRLGLGPDAGHAFYLGVELARAEIAYRLGKRYSQDEPLGWGCAVERRAEPSTHLKAAGATLEAGRRQG